MKYLLTTILYFLSAALILALSSLILEGSPLYFTGGVLLVVWLLTFLNLHKLILVLLGAREIIDTDHQDLFQCVKFNVYGLSSKTPKIYSYSGTFKNSFILESEKEWIIVIDKKLLEDSSKEVLLELITYLFRYHQKGHALLKTKILGLSTLYYSFVFGLFRNIFLLSPDSRAFKVLSTFFILIVKPITFVTEKILRKNNRIFAGENLKPLYLQCPQYPESEILISLNSSANLRPGKLLLDYLESFPVIRECEFNV